MSVLFTPFNIKHLTLRNRVVMPPMVSVTLEDVRHDVSPEGHVTEAIIRHYERRAHGGAGLIMIEATAAAPEGRCWYGGLNAYEDSDLPGLTRLVERIHAGAAAAGIQLVFGGPRSNPEITGTVVEPSTVTIDRIHEIQRQFADAATRCTAAGFDIIEIHGAHGFLLDAFLSPVHNTRTDDYGGSMANRVRMMVETCSTVREQLGHDAVLACRVSAFNHLKEGYSVDDFATIVRGLTRSGIDLLDISVLDGVALDGYFNTDKTLGQWARDFTELPTIVAGGLGDPSDAERLVRDGHADLAAVGRAMLENPNWARHAQEALT